ncbi:alpha/beta hydrolase family protein [Pedobacter sp.]|uniref:alpha/beta hydrolase family protein n=1 Tax=Pedobacter sp. TaxID=1411316 RepID=UPI00396C77A0
MRTLFYNIASLIFLLTNFITVSGQERPQTPIPPFPYQSIEVSYVVKTDTAVRLAASLTIPEGKGPFPAVLIIGGSGQVTRDQPFYNHKTMWVLADFLTRNGFATLRFDDRGAGKSTAGTKKQSELLEADLVADAAAGFDFLRQHPSIDPSKIGIIGHSAGARQGVEIASQEERNAYFAIMLAGAVESFPHDIVAHQSKLMKELLVARPQLRKSIAVLWLDRSTIQSMSLHMRRGKWKSGALQMKNCRRFLFQKEK